MVDLGKYAVSVLGSYGATLGILVVLIGLTWLRSRRTKARLEKAEARRG